MAPSGRSAVDNDPVARWQSAMERLYPTSPSAPEKGLPAWRILGSLRRGIGQGNSRRSIHSRLRDNKGMQSEPQNYSPKGSRDGPRVNCGRQYRMIQRKRTKARWTSCSRYGRMTSSCAGKVSCVV